MVLITRTSLRRTSLSEAEDWCLYWRYSCHTFDIIFCGLYGCCGQQTVHTNTRLRYKEIPLSLISCLLWQWKKLLYQPDISQEGGKNYESEQRKKRKLSLLKIHLIAGKMAHTLILQARLICFSKPLRDLFDQKHSTFFMYILLQNCPF